MFFFITLALNAQKTEYLTITILQTKQTTTLIKNVCWISINLLMLRYFQLLLCFMVAAYVLDQNKFQKLLKTKIWLLLVLTTDFTQK